MRKKALIIENDPTIRECIEVMYEAEGLEVISASDGATGLELSRRHVPDLVVSDLYMVGCSGIDLFEQLREDPHTGDIPFLFITADARDAVREHCLALGADAFLLKPFTFDELMDVTRTLLHETG
ncbi:MAG: response regulator [Rhodothermales bacterium]